MSYASLITILSQKLTQPTGIAVMASAGIHALVGVALPYLPSQENPNSPQTVQLVELTPTDLSRIPDLAPPPLPPTSALYPTPLTSAFPPLPPLNPAANKPAGSGSSRVDLNALKQQLSQRTKLGSMKIENAPVRPGQQRSQTTAKRLFQPNNPNLRIADHPTVRLNPPSRERFRASGIPRGVEPSTPFPALENSAPVNPPVASNRPVNPSRDTNTFIDSPVAINTPTNPPADSTINDTTRERQPVVAPPERLAPENSRTNSNDEYVRNSINALARMETGEVKAYSRVRGNYPKEACSERLSGTSIITVKVDGQGNVVGRAEVSRASSPIFDRIALSTVRGMKFAATGQALAYQVPVYFEYDSKVCESVRESQAPEETPEPTPAETPEEKSNSTETEAPNPNSTETPRQNSTETPRQNSTETPNPNSAEG